MRSWMSVVSIAVLMAQARANGGAAFDAARSGWPTPEPPELRRRS